MKRIFIILSGALLLSSADAQTLPDSAVYNKGIRMIESSKTYQDFERAGNYFDVLTNAKRDEWLAPLYSALSFILASFREPDTKLKETLCNKAQVYIDTSGMRHPDVSELASMQAFLYQARIDVSPMERGLEYSLKADSEIKKAEAANPGDPRAYFLYAMNVYYTPKIFGGGPGKALPQFEKAAEKFNEFVPKMAFMPHWGKQQNLDMIAKCRKEEKD
jgi:hypothetical protein